MAKRVAEEPHVILTRWAIIRSSDAGKLHFFGRKENGQGRVSSAIVNFDLATMSGQTRSGRRYTLTDTPESDRQLVLTLIARAWGPGAAARAIIVSPQDAATQSPAKGRA